MCVCVGGWKYTEMTKIVRSLCFIRFAWGSWKWDMGSCGLSLSLGHLRSESEWNWYFWFAVLFGLVLHCTQLNEPKTGKNVGWGSCGDESALVKLFIHSFMKSFQQISTKCALKLLKKITRFKLFKTFCVCIQVLLLVQISRTHSISAELQLCSLVQFVLHGFFLAKLWPTTQNPLHAGSHPLGHCKQTVLEFAWNWTETTSLRHFQSSWSTLDCDFCILTCPNEPHRWNWY